MNFHAYSRAWPSAAVLVALSVAAACADKQLGPSARELSPKLSLQVTTQGSQQASFGPRWLVVAAGFDGDSASQSDTAGGVLAYTAVPYSPGTQRTTLSVDISRCLAYWQARGRGSCPLLVGASLLADTAGLGVNGGNGLFNSSFDFAMGGPFDVAPGRPPTLPAINLSASRFGVIQWEGDEALRLGGSQVASPSGPYTGISRGGGAAAIVVPTSHVAWSVTPGGRLGQVFPALGVFENGQWRRIPDTDLPGGSAFTAVGYAAGDLYAAHASGLYRLANGSTAFTRISGITDSLVAVAGAPLGARYVIAGAKAGIAWVGDTQTWKRYNLGTAGAVSEVCITGPTEAFAIAANGIWRFDGTQWAAAPSPGSGATYALLQCPGPGQVFVMGTAAGAGGNHYYKWCGNCWSELPKAGLPASTVAYWAVTSGTEMYAWASDVGLAGRVYYRFDGTTWKEVGRRRFAQSVFWGMWADPSGGAAYLASAFGRVERVTAAGVSVVSYEPSLRDIMVVSPTTAYAVGWNVFLARWDGVKWNLDPPPAGTPSVRIMQGVWADGPHNAWAVGGASTIFRWDGTAWSKVSDALAPITTTDSYNAVWGLGSSVWIVGDQTILRCSAPATCATEATGGSPLYSIWGTASGAMKLAVGAGGRILQSLGGGAWQPMPSPTTRTLVRVSGSGPGDVWALGDSVLLHFDGSQWTNVAFDGDLRSFRSPAPSLRQGTFQLGLWVRGPREVYVGSEWGGIARWDGAQWREMPVTGFRSRILSISGAPGGCALAVTTDQWDVLAPRLWRGIGPSGCFASPMTPPPSWP